MYQCLAQVAGPRPQGWYLTEKVVLGPPTLQDGNVFVFGNYSKPVEWEDFAAEARKAIAGAPETPFEIRVRLAVDGG
jgi:hypothetical protein